MSQTPAGYEPYTPGRPGPERPWRPSDAVARPRADVEPTRRTRACGPSYGGAPDCLVIASVVCVVIWATSGFGYFWPIWVLLPTFLPALLRLPTRLRGGPRTRTLGPKS